MHNPFLIGARVYLRSLERDDAPLLVAWINDPEVTTTLDLFYRPLDVQSEIDFIERVYRDGHDVALGIVITQTDTLIGVTGLHHIDLKNRHVSLGIFIGEKGEWGKGYATEATALMVGYAFETLHMNRVWLHVDEHNERGIRAYEKVGFKREGLLRQDRYHDGCYQNTVTMAVLREEWKKGKSET